MSKFENDLLHFIYQHSFTMTISSAENNIRAVVNNMQCRGQEVSRKMSKH